MDRWNYGKYGIKVVTLRLCFEVILVGLLIKLFLKSRLFDQLQLTDEEKEQVLQEWVPEPLVPTVPDDNELIVRMKENVVQGYAGKILKINGKECINMATFNFLGLLGDKTVEKESIKRLRFYGVGTCGPRGFYGTTDTHLECENRFCEYLNTEMAVLYSHGFLTVTSAMATYSKRNDVIFVDMGASFAVTQGLRVSRSNFHFFRHNDMEHLEELLIEHQKWEIQNPKKAKATKKLIVVEGLYLNIGDICPLPRILEFRDIYKVRVMVDESFSLGILGKTGRGITEHYGLSVGDIDVFTANLENTFASVGGLSVGKKWVLDKQRMGSLGYAYSASQPPLCVGAIIQVVNILEESNEFISECRQTCEMVQEKLSDINGLTLGGLPISPVKHLYLSKSSGDRGIDYDLLQRIIVFIMNNLAAPLDIRSLKNNQALGLTGFWMRYINFGILYILAETPPSEWFSAKNEGVALVVTEYLNDLEWYLPNPSIRIAVNRTHLPEDVDKVVNVLRRATKEIVSL